MKMIIERCKNLPKPLLVLHLLAKLVFGLGVGVLLVNYLQGWGWWLIVGALALSLPIKYKMIDKIREFSTPLFVMLVAAEFIFGVGLGVIFINHLIGFGWLLIGLSLVMSIPSAYQLLKKR